MAYFDDVRARRAAEPEVEQLPPRDTTEAWREHMREKVFQTYIFLPILLTVLIYFTVPMVLWLWVPLGLCMILAAFLDPNLRGNTHG